MADKPIPLNPQAQATRDRDLVIRCVRDDLLVFVTRKFEKERGKNVASLGPEVAALVEGLAEAMAVLHVDALLSIAEGRTDAYQRKVEIAKARDGGR
jgi:hypothetical protein